MPSSLISLLLATGSGRKSGQLPAAAGDVSQAARRVTAAAALPPPSPRGGVTRGGGSWVHPQPLPLLPPVIFSFSLFLCCPPSPSPTAGATESLRTGQVAHAKARGVWIPGGHLLPSAPDPSVPSAALPAGLSTGPGHRAGHCRGPWGAALPPRIRAGRWDAPGKSSTSGRRDPGKGLLRKFSVGDVRWGGRDGTPLCFGRERPIRTRRSGRRSAAGASEPLRFFPAPSLRTAPEGAHRHHLNSRNN